MKFPRFGRLILMTLVVATPLPLCGVETAFWQIGSFDEFLQGTLEGVSLSKAGDLTLAPETRVVFSPEEALSLALTQDSAGNVYVGTGHQGKVFRVTPDQKSSLFFTAHEPDVFALAAGPDGALYVGTSPEGKVYRVTPDGKSSVFYDPRTKYIWALLFDSAKRLYVATGDKGTILRVDPAGKGEVFFDSKQTHIMCLRLDPHGNILAGSVPNGLIYRISPEGKAFVLYQSNLPEVHDLALDAAGHIFAATLGGMGGKGTPEFLLAPQGVPQPGGVTTVTVTASTEPDQSATKGQTPSGEPTAHSFNRPAPTITPTAPFQIAQGRGALVEIFPDSTAETVWSSNNESIFALATEKGHVLFSTDGNGRVFDLEPARDGGNLTLLTETHESLATRMLQGGSQLYLATSNAARLLRVDTSSVRDGNYEAPVKDTKYVSHWGVLAWRGEVPQGSALEFYTRSGNSERPDHTWSDWAGPYKNSQGDPVRSDPARYIQWKAVFRAGSGATPTLDEVTLSYLNQNLPPQIHSLNVSTSGERTSATGGGVGAGISSTLTVTPPPPGGFGNPPGSGAPAKAPVTLTWQADDPNGDQLTYSLFVRATDEHEWHLLKDRLHQATYTIEPSGLADGKYVARLVASDEDSNPPDLARKSELLSAPFWVDNTPPEIEVLRQESGVSNAQVQFVAEDSTSPLRSAESSLDGKDWHDVTSDDGIIDSRKETFTIKLSNLEPGEHVLTLRAYDTAGNAGVGKAVIRVPGDRSR